MPTLPPSMRRLGAIPKRLPSCPHIDIVCTRASNIGASKSTDTDALLHTRFLSDLWHVEGVTKKQGITFRRKKTRGKIVSVVKLRHAKVV